MALTQLTCTACGAAVSPAELSRGSARRVNGETFCSECLLMFSEEELGPQAAPNAIRTANDLAAALDDNVSDGGRDAGPVEPGEPTGDLPVRGPIVPSGSTPLPRKRRSHRRRRATARRVGGARIPTPLPVARTPAPRRSGSDRHTAKRPGSRRQSAARGKSGASKSDRSRAAGRGSRAAQAEPNPLLYVSIGVGVVVLLLVIFGFIAFSRGRRAERAARPAATEDINGDQGSVEANRAAYWRKKFTVIDIRNP